MFKLIFPAVLTTSLVERVLLVKLFYENKGIVSVVVREIRRRKNLLREPKSTKNIQAMIKRFEETGKSEVQPGRGRKRITPVLVDNVKAAVDHVRYIRFRTVARVQFLDRQSIFKAPSEKYSENILHYSSYMILQIQELLDMVKSQHLSHSRLFFSTD
ncbi:hypothetical protein TNCT_310661 [Trichonephila clavata]|uniref:DUF4817 domain-containing protein n=1 Tax=Trichonephila clavata TaxID=2740835 RepID=A0A8X6KYE9_TRICU|nr:hypothetical protein TNCT_310661 [Trichonephila clavata]